MTQQQVNPSINIPDPIEFNKSRVRASEVYLVTKWSIHTGTPSERRSQIFQEFVKSGMRSRWEWHRIAETYIFSKEEKTILECRTWKVRSIAFWMSADDRSKMVLMTTDPKTLKLSEDEPEYYTKGEPSWLYCEYDRADSPFGTVPEIAYSLTMFDDPVDVKEAQRESITEARQIVATGRETEPDQSLWVSGVYRVGNRIVWVDEYGETIREMRSDMLEVEEDAELFESYKPFETSWWLEATRIGKYAEHDWWI